MRTISQNIVLFYCFTMILLASCRKDSHENKDIEIDSLESLKAAFDHGMITHVDFKTIKQDNILNDKITAVELIYDEVGQFPYLKLLSVSEKGKPHSASLTLDHSVKGSIAEDMVFAPWVETHTYLNGKKIITFTPYTVIFESGITSSGLNIMSDTLQIDFRKK
ncbi:hypothetical protein ATE84_2881 [Aquimarina sp. MAR_2010_214]|uniref:hypothetical protein n=1 Tax=Aquimarina sp. MAR_2010_214 TaxID=1250026 RepID=UPI000CC2F6BE|nr:hypothetical protein [Aquimarina sp. MAR_2010_214]PKV50814.1 hypothetical protein ATE84_2881 [Aquimarina sp. MAR_2010_214]